MALKYRVQYIPAKFWGTGQGNNLGRTVTMHTVECPNQPGYAPSLAVNWFQSDMAGHPASAHFMVDPTNSVAMVDPMKVAWHCGNGNTNGLGIEQAGHTADTRAQWLGDKGTATMLRAADIAAAWMKPRGIPVVWLSAQQTANGAKGINSHNIMRLAFGGTSHTDPDDGRSDRWPHDVFLKMVGEAIQGYPHQEEDVPNTPAELKDAAYEALQKWATERHDPNKVGDPSWTFRELLDNAPETSEAVKALGSRLDVLEEGGEAFADQLSAVEGKLDRVLELLNPPQTP